MGEPGEVDDGVGGGGADRPFEGGAVEQVGLEEVGALDAGHGIHVGAAHPVPRREQVPGEPRSHEAADAGDQDAHQ